MGELEKEEVGFALRPGKKRLAFLFLLPTTRACSFIKSDAYRLTGLFLDNFFYSAYLSICKTYFNTMRMKA